MLHSAHHVPSAGPPIGGRRAGWPVQYEEDGAKFNCSSSPRVLRLTRNNDNERLQMTTLKQWADTHGPQPVTRIAGRLERFAGNTGDPETALAAAELCKMLRDTVPAPKAVKDVAESSQQ